MGRREFVWQHAGLLSTGEGRSRLAWIWSNQAFD